nr:MAG TPA: hypothetical protein [Caudoviricetes sp.]
MKTSTVNSKKWQKSDFIVFFSPRTQKNYPTSHSDDLWKVSF